MNKAYEYKGTVSLIEKSQLVKDIDEAEGRIRGYFAVFGNVDSDGDMIMPGAFKRSIQNNARRIKHLWQHNPVQPLSTPTVVEDGYGLLFDSVISKTSYGRDALRLYLDGVIDEHSIGFNTTQQNKKDGYTEITQVKLWEGSSVTWGANELARTENIKNLTKEQAFERMEISLKAFRNGTYEQEEIFDLLEIYTKQLQQHILDLTTPTIKMSNNANIDFIDMMTPHHKEAIKMVKRFDGKVSDEALKKIMSNIEQSQTKEIAQMAEIKNRLNKSLDLTESSTPPVPNTPAPQKGLKANDVMAINTQLQTLKLSLI